MKKEVIQNKHKLEKFNCKISKIDNFLKESALLDNDALLSKTYVVTNKDNEDVIAFCTLMLHSLKNGEKEFIIDKEKYSERRVPALLIGQLGVDEEYKGKKIGTSLIKEVISDALKMQDYIHFPVIIVDANREALIPYYEDKGFTRFTDNGLRLFLSMKEINKTHNELS